MILRRTPALFRVIEGVVLVTLLDGHALDLGGAAAAVWLAVDEPCDVATLTDRLQGLGLPDEAVAAAVQQLRDAGLLTSSP
ncbi:MAG: hypothetical protein ABMA25_02810 [Ilumatobacteraceae bacterium]